MWIECINELPKNKSKIIDGETYYKDLYVQYGNGNLTISFYDEEQKQWFMRMGLPLDNIIRWCDCLPEPPKEN